MSNIYKTNLAIIDIETSGLSPTKHEILEIGMIKYDYINDKIINKLDVKVSPVHIETADQEALKVCGYTKKLWKHATNIKKSLQMFRDFTKNCILLGQNINKFDILFIEKGLRKHKIKPKYRRVSLDLCSLAWPLVAKGKIDGLSLHTLCDYFKIPNDGEHNALIDCQRTLEVYKKLITVYTP